MALSNASPALASLTDAELLELSGEEALDDVRDLNLRSKGLSSLQPWVERVPQLTALSLSHNKLTSLQALSCLRLLTTLNVNFNQLASLEGVQHCTCLNHLFAANNMVRDLTPLATLTDLRTLSMYRNAIASLDAALNVLSALPLLHDVELGGNPCALVPEYKARMVLDLPTVQTLDGEPLSQLDNELAEEQLAAGSGAQHGQGNRPSAATSSGAQVLVLEDSADTAKAAARGEGASSSKGVEGQVAGSGAAADLTAPDLRSSDDREAAAWTTATTSAAAGAYQRPGSALMRPGTAQIRPGTASARPGTAALRPGTAQRPGTASVRLVGNEFLNDHPILLEYLARHVLSEGLALTQQQTSSAQGEGGSIVSRLRSSFVSRLRDTAAVNLANASLDPRDIAASGQAVVAGLSSPDARAAALESLVLDASPQETIRQLVRLCEVLIKEVEAARQRPGSSGPGRPSTASPSPSRPGTGSAAGSSAAAGAALPAKPGVQRPPSSGAQRGLEGGAGAAAGAGAGPVQDAETEHLRAEVARLTRELKQLQVENQNVYWLAEEYKTAKAELKKLQGAAGATAASNGQTAPKR